MAYHILSIFLFLIPNIYLNYYVLGFTSEGIIGGYYAPEGSFKYQVAIVAKCNFSTAFILICGGSIIHPDYILSAAHCVYDNLRTILERSLLIKAGTNYLFKKSYQIEIDEIYLPIYEVSLTNDLAVGKLRESLKLEDNEFLSKLNLPPISHIVNGHTAIVSGYGYHRVHVFVNLTTQKMTRLNGDTDLKLKYGYVYVVEDNICQQMYRDIDSTKEICGIMITKDVRDRWGVCTMDSGGPLVTNNTVVGIVSRNLRDCDDTKIGCIYTKVTGYLNIIRNILHGIIPPKFITYYNRPYVLEQPKSTNV